jgi:hypothetical protein
MTDPSSGSESLFPQGRFYQHSGKIPRTAIPKALIVLIPSAIIIGFLYGVVSFWTGRLASLIAPVPFIGGLSWIINLLPLGIFAVAIAVVANQVGQARSVRSPTMVALLSVGTACFAYYVSWAAWLACIMSQATDAGLFASTVNLLGPRYLWAFVNLTAMARPLEFYFSLPKELNWVVWAIEALLVLGVAWIIARGVAVDRPFCEDCGKWFTQEDDACWFEGTPNPDELLSGLSEDSKEPLDLLTPMISPEESPDGPQQLYKADLEYCPDCGKACTMDIVHVDWQFDDEKKSKDKRELKKSETPLIENLWVTPEHFARIRGASTDAKEAAG